MKERTVTSIWEFVEAVQTDRAEWDVKVLPWFRGEPSGRDVDGNDIVPLLPKVYRRSYDENSLYQFFRMKAPMLGLPIVPAREEIDKWLFVARHVGLPTRLLDWTEGALIGLYFAIRERDPVVWMLNPHALNQLTGAEVRPNEPTITWWSGPDGNNIYYMNIRDSWEGSTGKHATALPVAIHPTNIHPRMSAQHSCFTIHGRRKESIAVMVDFTCLRQYRIEMPVQETLRELRVLGISRSTLFPEPEGLAIELEELFRED